MRAYMWGEMKDWLLTGAIETDEKMATDLAGPGYHINRSNLLVLESKAEMQKRGQSGTQPALNRNKRLVRMPPDLFLTDLARKLPTKRVGVRRMRVMASQNES